MRSKRESLATIAILSKLLICKAMPAMRALADRMTEGWRLNPETGRE